ncbi:Hepatoma-derived growth factor-related protein 3 [Echinococcus granulosus]|uniref:Hepatoma-derived growth factor-related protein 3 n=1 Tax=Echinococcus granulosus TaxID=6210 RepID=W6UM93_ECHGR|nr:Hepatoma-derived growth factor-related protein 3 [Echinococcus granulosus]EUB62256.1 Hepatoma-derived growth factor-related protein 3 [Echinococcus granulosus]
MVSGCKMFSRENSKGNLIEIILMAYKPCDRIFAKVKGFPYWPARINVLPKDVKIPKGKYPIFFYGTHEVYFLAPKDICPYERWKHKYAVSKNRSLFQKGLEEIENDPDVLLYGRDADAEQFLSQFYEFKRSAVGGPSSLDEELPTLTEASADDAPMRSVSKNSGVCSRRSSIKHTNKESEKRLSRNHESTDGTKQESLLEVESGEVNPSSTDVISSTNNAPATTALGRPMRKSASRFSAMKLLKAGMAFADDEGSNEDADWHPTIAHTNDASDDYVPAETPSTPLKSPQSPKDGVSQKGLRKRKDKLKPVPSERLKRPISPSSNESSTSTDPGRRDNRKRLFTGEPRRCKKRSVLLPSPIHRRERSRKIGIFSVSMTAEELNNRLNQQNGQKQLEELGTEARLHKIDIGIKTSLIRGQEDIPTCLQRLEALDKMELTLPVLVKCSCSRYKPSMDVRIAALKVFNRFLKIRENASKEEMEEAHAELIANNKQLLTSSSQKGPSSVADIFRDVQKSQANMVQQKPPVSQPKSPIQPAKPSSPPANATLQASSQPPASPPPVPQLPTIPFDTPASHSPAPLHDQSSVPIQDAPDSPTPSNASDSEGLAPSLGDLEGGESMESGEDSLLSPSNSLFKSLNAEATVAAVKQVFFQRTKDKMAAATSRTQQSSLSPPTQLPPSTVTLEPDAYSSLGVELNRPLPPQAQEVGIRRVDPRRSPGNRRRLGRERARSPHALPHPLEHYQKFLRNGEAHLPQPTRSSPPPVPPSPYARAATDDLDTRIARLLEAAAPQPHQRQEFHPPDILSPPPPPPPPLPPSQNLILSHRPPPLPLHPPLIPTAASPAYTPASPVLDGANDGQYFDLLNMWPLQQSHGSDEAQMMVSEPRRATPQRPLDVGDTTRGCIVKIEAIEICAKPVENVENRVGVWIRVASGANSPAVHLCAM